MFLLVDCCYSKRYILTTTMTLDMTATDAAASRDIVKLKLQRYTPRTDKLVGDWISAPSRSFVAMATRLGPATFCMVPLNRPLLKTPFGAKILHVQRESKKIPPRFCGNFSKMVGNFSIKLYVTITRSYLH